MYVYITITGTMPPLVDCKSSSVSSAYHWYALLNISIVEIDSR